jgi:hypothetical protein
MPASRVILLQHFKPKTFMKHARLLLVLLVCASVVACKKGDTGPEGPAGPAGPQGPQGATGTANVTQYLYGSKTFTSSLTLTMNNITQGKIDSSLVLAYYSPSTDPNYWYPIPGFGSVAAYQTRFYLAANTATSHSIVIRVHNADGTSYTSPVTWNKTKVLIVPAATIINGRSSGQPPVDVNDYYAVMKYYNLQD